jgi:threonine/homoserine/homoserine lactone efflux protein
VAEAALFAQSLLIGLSIAAPVGPIGLLVIQRTLRSGARVGLATGLGAAVADALYGAVGAFGVHWLIDALVGAPGNRRRRRTRRRPAEATACWPASPAPSC